MANNSITWEAMEEATRLMKECAIPDDVLDAMEKNIKNEYKWGVNAETKEPILAKLTNVVKKIKI